MDPVRRAAFQRRVMNRRFRAAKREARRLRALGIAPPPVPLVGSLTIPKGFRPIPNQIMQPVQPRQAGGCAGCGKRAQKFRQQVNQVRETPGKNPDAQRPPAITLAGKSSQPALKR